MSDNLTQQIRQARGKFIAMAVSYSLGVFNDNFFRESALLIAVAAGRSWFQGVATSLFALPYVLFAAPCGWLADRFPKRRVVIASKALEVAAMVCGALGVLMTNWWLMLAMVFLMGLQSAIFGPSLNGSIPELYPVSYVTSANAKLKVGTTGAILLGIGAAGIALGARGTALGGVPMGQVIVAAVVLAVAIGGFAASFGVPRRPAAAPGTKFPYLGPLSTLSELYRIRKDPLLAVAIVTDAFVFSAGSVLVLVVNELGLHQYGLSKAATGGLIFAELLGLAVGGLTSSRIGVGERWYRVLSPAAVGMGAAMAGIAYVPLLPETWEVPALVLLLAAAGFMGGLMIIPCEAFIQVRPEAGRKGTVIAASNFTGFAGIMVSGPVAVGLLSALEPTTCFAAVAGLTIFLGLMLAFVLPAGPGNPVDLLLAFLARLAFRLRYRIEVKGLDEVAARGTRSILFLPNHPGLIDPPIMVSVLFPRFGPWTWGDEEQLDRPVIRTLARRFGVLAVPAASRRYADPRAAVRKALDACVENLRAGRSVLVYPSGHVYRSCLEDLRGNTAVHTVLEQLPDVRVVLVRTTGLWGSGFSWAGGSAPSVGRTLRRGGLGLLASGVFFAPRRRVTIEFVEPDGLPRAADRETLNAFMERFYNERARPNTYVPYSAWERGGARPMPEPFIGARPEDTERVPAATRELVVRHLAEVSGAEQVRDENHLARDLGLDSLARMELAAWLGQEFGHAPGDAETLQTVADVLLTACGEALAGEPALLKPFSARWFAGARAGRIAVADGATITEAFLNVASASPGRAIIADQAAGVRTYRDLVTAVLALEPEVRRLAGERVGIMLPASVAADVAFLAALFAGKTPVMVNWTLGPRTVAHALALTNVRSVLTARALVARLGAQGVDLSALSDGFVFLEDVARRISLRRKLLAWLRARLSWKALAAAPAVKPADAAVILFTSGSEALPKAVPLTHANLLANARDLCAAIELRASDRMIGILPPFHSFGLTVTAVLPLCAGLPVVYHPDPTEGGMLARLIEAYKVTMLLGTPTFLNGILRASTTEQLATLRLAVTGAEKCPERVYDALAARCPQTSVLEGYGVTECSPVISVNDQAAPCRGAIGKPLPTVRYEIVDPDTGRKVAPGERGMLIVRGPSVFAGYLNYDGPSPFVEMDGQQWYRTGDLVSADADGVLTFAGRLKRFTKLGGEMISLPAVEEVLARHYAAEDDKPLVAVECTPDAEHPEIVLFAACDVTREEANRRIREAGLSGLHNIRRVVRLEAIPLLGTGKTDYRALREMLRGSA
jgi:acyl-CoA synthetase (AMP-forming)/AMP-acid ligase II/1-acyl-sn-glycerol-3-phosphate acyltransferase/acyl carrier protein/predicted MFS family arabinose efflux permease